MMAVFKYIILLSLFLYQCESSLRRAVTPEYYVCPGINTTERPRTANVVKVGIMLSLPSDTHLVAAGINTTRYADTLIPGDLLLPLSHLGTAALRQATIINKERLFLPDHELCLYFTFVPFDLVDITLGSNYLYTHSKTYITVNALTDQYQFKLNRDLMVSFGNMITVQQSLPKLFECPNTPNVFDTIFTEDDSISLVYDERCEPHLHDTHLEINLNLVQLLKASQMFMKAIGWDKYGIITSCTSQELWQHKERGIYLSYYTGDFLSSFRNFQENELRIMLFIGKVCDYFDFLIQAHDHKITTSSKFSFVFALQNFNPKLHLTESLVSLCKKNFTDEQILKIKASLDKTIIIHPECRCRNTPITTFADSNLDQLGQCMQGFISDAVSIAAIAANNVFNGLAIDRGVNKSALYVDKSDYKLITNQLQNISFFGRSGYVEFDESCHRVANTFSAINIFTKSQYQHHADYSNQKNFDDSVLDRRAFIFTRKNNSDGSVVFVMNDEDIEKSMFFFKDNTTDIPLQSPKRFYRRDDVKVFSIVLAILVWYLVTTLIHIMVIHWRDSLALKYSEKWLVELKDIQRPTVQQYGRFARKGFQKDSPLYSLKPKMVTSYGVYNNGLVQIETCNINVQEVTSNNTLREDILYIMEISHPNVCLFHGCVSDGNSIIGVMYEHTARWTLSELLLSQHFELNETRKNGFSFDLIRGLQYLHRQKIHHGRLNLTNCLVDGQTLKITNFGLHSLHTNDNDDNGHVTTANEKDFCDWKAPECRLLGCPTNTKADIYSLGAVLKEVRRQAEAMISGDGTMCIDPLDDVYQQVIEQCMSHSPNDRPSIDSVKSQIKKMLSFDQKMAGKYEQRNHGLLEVYSYSLEREVDEVLDELKNEVEHNDAILSNYIPDAIIASTRNGVPIPVRVCGKGVLFFMKLDNFESLFEKHSCDIACGIVSNIDKAASAICKSHKLERVQYNGSLWSYVGGVYSMDSQQSAVNVLSCVSEAVDAAFEVLEEFKLNHQHHNDSPLSLTIVLDYGGPLVCGLMSEVNPVHIAAGDLFHQGLVLLSATARAGLPLNGVFVSEAFRNKLEHGHNSSYDDYCVSPCNTIMFKNEPIEMYHLSMD